ncbi:MAG: sugar phosphate isomerase/epimerase family protein [Bacteroidota bacterium]
MKPSSTTGRRNFLRASAAAGAGLLLSPHWSFASKNPNSRFGGVQVGAITYSFRSMPGSIDQLIEYCTNCGISAIELMGDPAEAWAGSPAGLMPPMVPPPPGSGPPKFTPEMRKAFEERALKARPWRESVGIEKFIELKKKFDQAGISIYAYKPDALNENSSDGEINYAMRAAKALGATSVTVELPRNSAHSKRLGDFGAVHQIYIGYHAHTQATDTAWDEALAQSPWNSLNLDCGHYIAAGGNNTKESLLALIEAKSSRITSMHIKDRQTKEHGAANLEWGKGDTPIREILMLMKARKFKFPATIELEYEVPAGSDAVAEVKKCVGFARTVLS